MLDKSIKSGKDRRKEWRGKDKSKNIDRTCRNHGSCLYCQGNRLHKFEKVRLTTEDKLKDYE